MAEKITPSVRTMDRATAPEVVDVAVLEKQVSALDVEVQQAMRSGHHDFTREFKDFLGVLTSLASEIKLDHPSAQTLESLGMAARHRWNKIAKMAVSNSPDGTPRADEFELNLIAQSKSTMDSILLSATLADPRNKDVQDDEVDKSPQPNDHQPMTDITRQQVTDLLAASEAKMDARLANFDASIKTGFADIRAEFSSLRADSHKMNADIKSWTLATMLTIIGTMLAAIFGVATIFNNVSKSSAPTAPPVPIVIYTQPATTAAPPTATLPPAAQK